MKLNTIIACIILWSAVEIVAAIASAIRRISLKQEHFAKKKYLQRLLELSAMEIEDGSLIRELYYSFVKDRRLRIVLLQAMRYPTEKSLMHIYSKLGCEPMKRVHKYLIKRIKLNQAANKSTASLTSSRTKDYWLKEVETWDINWNNELKMLKRKKVLLFLEKNFAHLINLWLYIELQTKQCLLIYVLVNTLGVVMYIIFNYECCVIDEKNNDVNFVITKYKKKMSQLFAKGIENTYQLAASLGLIINITTVVMNWLGPVA